MKKLLIVLIVIFFTSGCFNYKELNDLGIVSAIGISKENDEFVIDVQLVNIIEAGKNGISEAPISVISGKGKTIYEAAKSLNLKSSKLLFISNIEYVLIDESVIMEDIEEVLDYLTRDSRLSLSFLIVTSIDDKPKEIMSALSQFDINSASNLSNIIKLSEDRYGESYSLTIKDLLDEYLQEGVSTVYPNIALTGDYKELSETDNLKTSDSDNYVSLKNLVFFTKDKEIVALSKEEAFGYNFLVNHINNATITCECEGGYFSIQTLKSDFGYKDKLNNNELDITGKIDGEIVYYGCNDDLSKQENINNVSKITSDKIKDYVMKAIDKAISKKTDFIGIGKYIYKNNNKYFDFDNKDWDIEGLPNLKLNYNVKLNIVKQGNLRGDIHE